MLLLALPTTAEEEDDEEEKGESEDATDDSAGDRCGCRRGLVSEGTWCVEERGRAHGRREWKSGEQLWSRAYRAQNQSSETPF